jgi:hypothetical protein
MTVSAATRPESNTPARSSTRPATAYHHTHLNNRSSQVAAYYKSGASGKFLRFSHDRAAAVLGSMDRDSNIRRSLDAIEFGRRVSLTKTRHLIAAGLAAAAVCASAHAAHSADCQPRHFRAPYFIKTMGPCSFDAAAMSFQGTPAEQAKCLMRGMDQSRNLSAPLESLPAALAERVGTDAGLPTREALSTYLSKLDLEWDFAAYLWQPLSHANDNDSNAPMARYFVIHDTSGPSYGGRPFPADLDDNAKINNLAGFQCHDGWGRAHVVINRSGAMLLNHELSTPWRETKFEQAANFSGALKGLFLHIEMIQPRRAASGRGRRNDAQSPDPAFTAAQYDRLALVYTVASVRAGQWLIPAFHAALDADIRNGHDDPLNFDHQSFATAIEAIVQKLNGADKIRAADR